MAEEDLIFGKNRHFFGGIEPSNMLAFRVFNDNGVVVIDAQLPKDTVVSGQTLCTVEGAVIRRRTDNYPVDEFDGEEIVNINVSGTFIDSTATVTGTYYYAAFPYTTQGVYNRNSANRVVLNEPAGMVKFTAAAEYDATDKTIVTVKITADIPDTVAGAVIRKSTNGYPVSETDGDACMTITADGVYTDTNVVYGATYYYSAFPYTSTGAYNRSDSNRVSITTSTNASNPSGPHKGTYLYGFDIDLDDMDPNTRVSYPEDVDNYGFTPGKVDSSGVFNYGSWTLSPGQAFMPKPCIVSTGTYSTVLYYLDPNNYGLREDGVTESDVAKPYVSGGRIQAMMEWPKIYTHRELVNGVYKFRCSDEPQSDDWDCWCNYDRNNNVIDNFYTSIYLCSRVDSVARSMSGENINTAKSMAEQITLSTNNGEDWHMGVLSDHLLIQDLLVLMAKSTDCQSAYGKGRVGLNTVEKTGYADSKGMFCGGSRVKVFGMEDYWGNAFNRIAGWICDFTKQKVKLTRNNHDGSTATDYNETGDGYITLDSTNILIGSGTTEYIADMKVEAYGRIPINSKNGSSSGSSSTYECDSMTLRVAGTFAAIVGGCYNSQYEAGPFMVLLHKQPSEAESNVGHRISWKPIANA